MSDLFSLSPIFIIIINQIKYPEPAACMQKTRACAVWHVSAVPIHVLPLKTMVFFRWQKQKSESHHQETAGASPAVCKIDICVNTWSQNNVCDETVP